MVLILVMLAALLIMQKAVGETRIGRRAPIIVTGN